MTRKQFLNLCKSVESFQSLIGEFEGRVSMCCSMIGENFTIQREWSKKMIDTDITCVTSMTCNSPVDTAVSRIASGLGI